MSLCVHVARSLCHQAVMVVSCSVIMAEALLLFGYYARRILVHGVNGY